MPAKKSPYSYPHKTRKDKADYICGIGGYSRYHDGSWPIEFCVGAWDTDFDFDHIWKKYAAEWWPFDETKETPDTIQAYYALARRLHKENEQHLWGWGQEDAYRSLHDGDCYRMLWDGTSLDVTIELHGRGGKHLVITEFEGHTLTGLDSDDLYQQLMSQHDGSWMPEDSGVVYECGTLRKGNVWTFWTTEDLNKLYKYVRQCEIDFTSEKASAEVEYQGAFCFFNNIVNSEWETVKKEMATHDEAVEAAKAVREVMRHAAASGEEMTYFGTLCEAAGISQDELE